MYTAINFVHVNGKSLYIAGWRMVVVEGVGLNVLHNIERGELSGRGICPGEYVHGEMSMQQTFSLVRGYVAGSQAHKAFLRP